MQAQNKLGQPGGVTYKKRMIVNIQDDWATRFQQHPLTYTPEVIYSIAREMQNKIYHKIAQKIAKKKQHHPQSNYSPSSILHIQHYHQDGKVYQPHPKGDACNYKPDGVYLILAYLIPEKKDFSLYAIMRQPGEKLILGEPGASGYIKIACRLLQTIDQQEIYLYQLNKPIQVTTVKYFHPRQFDSHSIAQLTKHYHRLCKNHRQIDSQAALGHRVKGNMVAYFLLTSIPPGISLLSLKNNFGKICETYGLATPQQIFTFIRSIVTNIITTYYHEIARNGKLHNDIKPGNIICIVCRDHTGRIYFIDFDTLTPADPLPKPAPRGTPAYLAPEVYKHKSAFPTEKTDIYSLGTIMAVLGGWGSEEKIPAQTYAWWEKCFPHEKTLNRFTLAPSPPEQDNFSAHMQSDDVVSAQYRTYRSMLFLLVREMMNENPSLRPHAATVIEKLHKFEQPQLHPLSPVGAAHRQNTRVSTSHRHSYNQAKQTTLPNPHTFFDEARQQRQHTDQSKSTHKHPQHHDATPYRKH